MVFESVFCRLYIFTFIYKILFEMFVICSLNINGLISKQDQIINFMRYNKIDILLIQEHNIRDITTLSNNLNEFCHVSLNPAICSRGGTAILIDRKLPFSILSVEKSADSRILSMKLKIYDQFFHLVNVYAHSFNKKALEREELFSNELIYYLRNSLQNTFLGGDWNCVLSERDTTSDNAVVSKALLSTIRTLNLKDIWFLKQRHVEYTYVRNNYGSRIDRAYVKELGNYVLNVKLLHVPFSDHSCLFTEFNLPNIPKVGRYYWKMNVSLLEDDDIKEKFKTEWKRMCNVKDRFQNLNEWWDLYVKKEIKSFFIREGKQIIERKYGMIKFLEYCLNRLYNKVNLTGNLEYDEVKILKNRIDELKSNILEGVKIRSRLKEQIDGEKVSAFLIKQQASAKSRKLISSIKTEANIVENLDSDVILKDKDSISLYIKNYYAKLYENESYDENYQNLFLQYVDKTLTEQEVKLLETNVTEKEIFECIKDMNTNKAPGIDGIPIEFYEKFWDIIKVEFSVIVINIVKGMYLSENQRKAIITLLPKDGDLTLLKSWRPISLICCDVKIVAKILAKRIKPLLYSLLSENQYCIEGRSIVDCNNKIRDVLYYSGKNNVTGAIINVDWEKAFDRVNWDFLLKIMNRMGFPKFVLTWIINLYTNIQSLCLVNGHLTDTFNVHKGVRQGCPLSMLFFVIFQNPLYVALEKAKNIKPLELPGSSVMELGYADDTNVFTGDDYSFMEIFRLFNNFEKATNSKINLRKTKVYGFGRWKNRIIWPVNNIKVEIDHFFTLGIFFSCSYDTALNLMWNHVYNKVKNRIPIISKRYFTLYQKASLINSLLTSKLWYVSHVYPLPLKFTMLINKEIFSFLWGSQTNPIKRDVLYNKRMSGGLGLLNIYQKSKSILTSTTIKSFLHSDETELIRYYMSTKIGNVFNVSTIPQKVSRFNTPYYENTIDIIHKCVNHKKFPNLKSKDIYEVIVPHFQPNIVDMYPNYDWLNIWRQLNFKFIRITDRDILFKYLYEILPTNKRLHQIRIEDSSLCKLCKVEDSNIHRFYYCCTVKECLSWLRKVIFYICGIQVTSLIKILSLDLPKIEKRNMNSLCLIISGYISAVWYNRKDLRFIKNMVLAKIIRDQRFNLRLLEDKAKKVFSENYCQMDLRILKAL